MSVERSVRRQPLKAEFDRNQNQIKGSYTQQGFYRKINPKQALGLSNLSQKQSIYDRKYDGYPPYQTSQFTQIASAQSQHPFGSTYPPKEEEYQIVINFQLKRYKEKNLILQERLKNKEIFIENMKKIQQELSLAFQKCQQELEFYKKKSSQPSVQAREYLEEIHQLKHLVIRLQDKITQYQKKENKRYSSVKNDLPGQDNRTSVATFQLNSRENVRFGRQKRSKTMMNQQDSSPQFRKFDNIEEFINKYPRRATSFISRFLDMVEMFCKEGQQSKKNQQGNIKRRLKIGWKWVKDIVGEWNYYKSYVQSLKPIHKKLRKLCNVPQGKDQIEAMQFILSVLRK